MLYIELDKHRAIAIMTTMAGSRNLHKILAAKTKLLLASWGAAPPHNAAGHLAHFQTVHLACQPTSQPTQLTNCLQTALLVNNMPSEEEHRRHHIQSGTRWAPPRSLSRSTPRRARIASPLSSFSYSQIRNPTHRADIYLCRQVVRRLSEIHVHATKV